MDFKVYLAVIDILIPFWMYVLPDVVLINHIVDGTKAAFHRC